MADLLHPRLQKRRRGLDPLATVAILALAMAATLAAAGGLSGASSNSRAAPQATAPSMEAVRLQALYRKGFCGTPRAELPKPPFTCGGNLIVSQKRGDRFEIYEVKEILPGWRASALRTDPFAGNPDAQAPGKIPNHCWEDDRPSFPSTCSPLSGRR